MPVLPATKQTLFISQLLISDSVWSHSPRACACVGVILGSLLLLLPIWWGEGRLIEVGGTVALIGCCDWLVCLMTSLLIIIGSGFTFISWRQQELSLFINVGYDKTSVTYCMKGLLKLRQIVEFIKFILKNRDEFNLCKTINDYRFNQTWYSFGLST